MPPRRLRLAGRGSAPFLGLIAALGLTTGAHFACRRPAEPAPSAPTAPIAPTGALSAESEWTVVLVEAGDVLNVRAGAGVEHPMVFTWPPNSTPVVSTGRTQPVDGAQWREVRDPSGTGWVNATYLSPASLRAGFAQDARPEALLERFAAALRSKSDLTPLVSRRGLYVAHFAKPRRFAPDRLATLMTSPDKLKWGGAACGDDTCVEGTFAEVVGTSFLGVWDDADKRVAKDQWLNGGNASADPPVLLAGFPYVAAFDPGDGNADGLDWSTWVASFDEEAGELKLVALTKDAWSP